MVSISYPTSIIALLLSSSHVNNNSTYIDGIAARNLQFSILDPLVAHLIEKPVLNLTIYLEQHVQSNIVALRNRLRTFVGSVIHPIDGFAERVADVDRRIFVQGVDLFNLFNVDVRAVLEHTDIRKRVLVGDNETPVIGTRGSNVAFQICRVQFFLFKCWVLSLQCIPSLLSCLVLI